MKIKIGIFLGMEPSGGGMFQYGISVLEALSRLPKDTYEVIAAYTYNGWLAYVNAYGIQPVKLPPSFIGRVIWKILYKCSIPLNLLRSTSKYFHPIIKTIVQQRCALWIFPSEDQLAYQCPVNSLVSIHDLMHRYERQFPEVSANGIFEKREEKYKCLSKFATAILVDSFLGKSQVMKCYGVNENRVHVLPYIAPKYITLRNSSPDFNTKYSLPNKFIFYPAQFWEHKNHKSLLLALYELKSKLPDLQLVLVGSEQNAFNDVVRLIQELGITDRVTILGYVPDRDIAEIYRRSRALVMPTFFGPTNIPPLEAFVVGCPVAISNIYGIPDQVGDAALLFNPKSVEEIAETIFRLWTDDDLAKELIAKGRRKALEWNSNSFYHCLEEIIKEII